MLIDERQLCQLSNDEVGSNPWDESLADDVILLEGLYHNFILPL